MTLVSRCAAACTVALALFSTVSLAEAETNWPAWRGPTGQGHSAEENLPTTWNADTVTWRTELPGRGQSSPVIWKDRIYLTAATFNPEGKVARIVLSVDRRSGEIVWRQTTSLGAAEESHKMNGYASATCATDGEVVVSFFGDGGLHCSTVDGKALWSRDLGTFGGPWGSAASPIILDELVIQNCDAAGKSWLLAVDKKTGKDVWRADRGERPRGGWSTPLLIDVEGPGETGHQELILNGEYGVRGYDPETGQELWFCRGFNGRGTPTPVWSNGLLHVINGKSGDIYAVRPGGRGDVTATHMAWHTPRRGGRDLPSPILAEGVLLGVDMKGVGTAYAPATGSVLWKDRIGGNFSASPVVAQGLIYLLNESGETIILRPGKQIDIVARNKLGPGDEIFRASPAISAGQIFLRSDRALYCVGKPAK